MKTRKIYWRLAFLLSLIPTITWIIVFASMGKLPIFDLDPDVWLIKYVNILPLWAFNKWLDIPGMFLIVFIIHNFPSRLRKIWTTNPQVILSATMYVLTAIVATIGFMGMMVSIIATNALITLFICIITLVITTCILWLAQQIPTEWQKKAIAWMMQK